MGQTNPFSDPIVEKKSCAKLEKHLFSLVALYTIKVDYITTEKKVYFTSGKFDPRVKLTGVTKMFFLLVGLKVHFITPCERNKSVFQPP